MSEPSDRIRAALTRTGASPNDSAKPDAEEGGASALPSVAISTENLEALLRSSEPSGKPSVPPPAKKTEVPLPLLAANDASRVAPLKAALPSTVQPPSESVRIPTVRSRPIVTKPVQTGLVATPASPQESAKAAPAAPRPVVSPMEPVVIAKPAAPSEPMPEPEIAVPAQKKPEASTAPVVQAKVEPRPELATTSRSFLIPEPVQKLNQEPIHVTARAPETAPLPEKAPPPAAQNDERPLFGAITDQSSSGPRPSIPPALLIAAGIIVLIGATAFFTRSSWMPSKKSAAPRTDLALQMQAEPQSGGLMHVRWNPRSPLIAGARDGRLVITWLR